MDSSTEKIGFVGVGLMGHGMAKNIVDCGYPLTVLGNRNRVPVDDLAHRGAVEAQSAKELAERSDIVFMCLPGSPQVEAIIRGENGLKEGLKAGSVVIDCSTADPVSTATIANELSKMGVDFADAPLGRTPKEAWEGTLDTMVGAKEDVFKRIEPILNVWAGKIVHIGDVGDGHRMKLLNNFLSLGYAAIYAEAVVLGHKVGISPDRFDSVIRGSRMDCGFYQTFMGYLIENNRDAHKFTLTNASKDLRYLESMADAVGLVNPVGNAVKNTFASAVVNDGAGPEDYVPHLVDYVAKLNGTKVTDN
jgi:hypothetical protein